ncbi:MAG: DUF302 domain-containing protein [Methylococcales symbiont of Hymedesmia sp. n. MRB-2018]|nr:MAG: DUF302 domain-containing protein [Methylococcales symbiont of Hymedesmia sp. n. MRB-2018]KAF3983881.1 MAG: DUF302 domain-containing protein [Methylococcales symbiont of Hymedesmia sp. n. MRB-2018]
MFKKELIFATLFLIASCVSLPPNSEIVHYYLAETTKPYDDVLAELKIAIAEHNFRITGHSRVGKVIRDRGTIPFAEYDTLQFCNLSHAKNLLQISPHAVSHMPCNIVTYQFNHKTLIKIRLLPINTHNTELNQFSEKMNPILKQIVDFAVEE